MRVEVPLVVGVEEAWRALSALPPARGVAAGYEGMAAMEDLDDDARVATLRLTGAAGPATVAATAAVSVLEGHLDIAVELASGPGGPPLDEATAEDALGHLATTLAYALATAGRPRTAWDKAVPPTATPTGSWDTPSPPPDRPSRVPIAAGAVLVQAARPSAPTARAGAGEDPRPPATADSLPPATADSPPPPTADSPPPTTADSPPPATADSPPPATADAPPPAEPSSSPAPAESLPPATADSPRPATADSPPPAEPASSPAPAGSLPPAAADSPPPAEPSSSPAPAAPVSAGLGPREVLAPRARDVPPPGEEERTRWVKRGVAAAAALAALRILRGRR